MKVHITSIYGMGGTGHIAQMRTSEIARSMGIKEIGLYAYEARTDSESELTHRIDGVISGVEPGDIVIIQAPTWNNNRYENRLITRIRTFPGTRIILMLHDVEGLILHYSDAYLQEAIKYVYNLADLVIVPSQKMLDLLVGLGMTYKKVLVQTLFDYPVGNELGTPKFKRDIFFSGAASRFSFLSNWRYKSRLVLFAKDRPEAEDLNLVYGGYVSDMELLNAYTRGGFGLVWCNDDADPYYELIMPYKLGGYLAAGIPVIMQRGLAPERLVLDNGLGYVADTLDEVDEIVQTCTEEHYNEMLASCRDISFMVRNGYFTRKLIADALTMLLIK